MIYTVEIDGQTILDPTKRITLGSPVLELADNTAGSFTFEIYPENPAYSGVTEKAQSPICFKRDGSIIWAGRVLGTEKRFNGVISVTCEGDLGLLDDSIQRPAEYHNESVRSFLTKLINAHNSKAGSDKRFTVGSVTVTDSNDSLYRYTNWESTLAVIKSRLLDRLGGHLRIRYEGGIRYLDYLKDSPKTAVQTIDFGKNLLDYVENRDSLELATVCIPLGTKLKEKSSGYPEALDERLTIASVNSGSDEISIPEAVSRYGRITRTITFDDVNVAQNLLEKGIAWLTDSQYEKINLSVTALDLATLGIESEPFDLLDRIQCRSDLHGLNRTFPLLQMSIHPLNPDQDTFTMGETQRAFTASIASAQKSIEEALMQTSPDSVLTQALENVRQMMNSLGKSGHVVLRSNEILIMDTEDIDTAVNVWRWNQAGFAHSSSGYAGPYDVAITMDGHIAGQYIAAGSIEADRLSVNAKTAIEKEITDGLGDTYYTAVETDAKIQAAADTVELSVTDRLKVNENLLVNTRNPQNYDGLFHEPAQPVQYHTSFRENCFRAASNINSIYSGYIYTSVVRFQQDLSYTFSFDCSCYYDGCSVMVVLDYREKQSETAYSHILSQSVTIQHAVAKRYHVTFTAPSTIYDGYIRFYVVHNAASATQRWTYFNSLKLEKGSVPTAWDINRSEVVNHASIKVLSDSITSRVTSGQVESIIEQKASSIRMKADTITWTAANSKMCSNGTIRSGSDDSYWVQLSAGELTGGYGPTQYAKIDASAVTQDLRTHTERRGIQMTGNAVRITTKCLATLDSTSESATHLIGYTGDVDFISSITANSDGGITWVTSTMHFENGLMVTDF